MEKLVEGAPKPDARMPYESPCLDVYGDLNKLTTNVGSMGTLDGGGGGTNKTH